MIYVLNNPKFVQVGGPKFSNPFNDARKGLWKFGKGAFKGINQKRKNMQDRRFLKQQKKFFGNQNKQSASPATETLTTRTLNQPPPARPVSSIKTIKWGDGAVQTIRSTTTTTTL